MKWLSKIIPGNAPDGSAILSVLGKKTYRFANGQTAKEDAEEQIPFLEADEFWGHGNPAVDAMKFESDLVAYKPMTDVVLIGNAHAARGQKVQQFNVGMQVGAARKIIFVTGDRKVYVTGTGFAFTDPKPFDEMPLDYSRAYGGKDDKSEEGSIFVYLRNPVGKGFIVKNNVKALQDLALPNLETPEKLVTPKNLVLGKFEQWKFYPDPAGFGYMGKNFHPRFTLAGLPADSHADAEVDRQRRIQAMPEVGLKPGNQPPPPMPMMNLEFFNGASPGLRLPYLGGGEAIMLANLDRDKPRFTFQLPGIKPKAWIDVGQGRREMSMVPHTVLILKEKNQVAMTWRGCVKYGGLAAMAKFTAFEFGVEE